MLGGTAILHYDQRRLHGAPICSVGVGALVDIGEKMSAPRRKINPPGSDNVVALQPHRHRGRINAVKEIGRVSPAQREWLMRGLSQPGVKLPLFDRDGQKFSDRTIKSCIRKGWAEPWFKNPIKADWLICKLTDSGRQALGTKV
jgi:hypothetical protein